MLVRITTLSFALAFAASCRPGGKDKNSSESSEGGKDGDTDTNANKSHTPGTVAINATLSGVDADIAVVLGAGATMTDDGPQKVALTGGSLALEVPSGSGTASLDDQKDDSTLILVMKEAETTLDAFESMQFVAAPTAGDESLVNLETSAAKVESIDLGTVSKQGEDLVGTNPIGPDQLDVPQSQLTEMAKLDDALRVKKNIYANDSKSGRVGGALEFYWDGDLADGLNAETDAKKLTFLGWSPQLQIDHPAFVFDELCDAASPKFKKFRFELPAPGAKRTADGAYETAIVNDGAKVNSDGRSCGAAGTGFYANHGTGQGEKQLFMNFGSGNGFVTEIPKGTWLLKVDDVVQAKFDLALSFPLVQDPDDAKARIPRVYVPAVNVVADPETHVVSKVELWFYTYDKTSKKYVKVEDYSVMKQLVQNTAVSLTQANVGGGQGADDGFGETGAAPWPENGKPKLLEGAALKHKWMLQAGEYFNCPEPEGGIRAAQVGVQYTMQGNRYMFNFKLPRLADSGQCK